MRVFLGLKRESWENIFRVLHEGYMTPPVAPGNFWASIQSLEQQLEDSRLEGEPKQEPVSSVIFGKGKGRGPNGEM